MFEVTIRTDSQAALQKLLEILASLDIQFLRKEETWKVEVPSKKKKVPETSSEVTVFLPENMNDREPPKKSAKPVPSISFEEWAGVNPDPEKYKPGFGCAKGMFEMSPDFDEPLEDFKEYMY